jgi:hypothetical protein
MSANRHADAAGVLTFLWDKFNTDAASDKDLWFLANAAEQAETMSASLADTVSGVAGLISRDQDVPDDQPGRKSGALQDEDLPSLLWGIADSVRTIGKLAFIGGEAGFVLQQRHAARAGDAFRRVCTGEDSSQEGA